MSVFHYCFLIIICADALSAFSNTIYNPKTNRNSVPLSISSTLVNSAIDVLEEQYYNRPDTPVDSTLRRYIKQHSRDLEYDSDEKDGLRELILSVARSQYRLDFKLRELGIECTPENRVMSYIVSTAHEKQYDGDLVKNLIQSNRWLRKFKGTKLDDDEAIDDLQTRLECPNWAWPDLNEAFPTTDELTHQ